MLRLFKILVNVTIPVAAPVAAAEPILLPMSSGHAFRAIVMKLAACLAFALCSLPTSAAERVAECRELVMVPIIAHGVPGAHGSLWKTHLAITNSSAEPVSVFGHGACEFNPCQLPDPIRPESTIFPRVYGPYLEVECGRMDDLSFQLRVQDLSRALDTWGTSLPVVREPDLFHQRVLTIADVPNTAEFRSMLRIYGFDPGSEGQVRVRFYALDATIFETGRGDQLILDTVQMVRPDPLAPVQVPPRLELPLWLVPQLEGHARLRVTISGGPELRLWGFVSVTNNSTQHVTVLAPQ